MRILIVGLGSIGKGHLHNLRNLVPDAKIVVWHQRSHNPEVPDGADIVVLTEQDAIANHPDAAIICNPAPFHVPTAQRLAEAGIHLLVEKPLSNTLGGIDELIATCEDNSLVMMVAYPLRFNSALELMINALSEGEIGRVVHTQAVVGQYLPNWQPAQDYRQSVSARAELGGGALLELSHELDYVRSIMGDPIAVSARVGQVSDLDIDVEDTADITLEFADGATANVHVDMIRQPPTRTCTVMGTSGTVEWDGITGTTRIWRSEDRKWRTLWSQSEDRNEMYVRELAHFLACVGGHATPRVTGADGKRVLDIVLAAKSSSKQRTEISL